MKDVEIEASMATSELIRKDIEVTKELIRADLEAIEAQVIDRVSIKRLRAAIRKNPLPWVLTAGGTAALALLLASSRRNERTRQDESVLRAVETDGSTDVYIVAGDQKVPIPTASPVVVVTLLTAEGLRQLRDIFGRRERSLEYDEDF